MTNLEFRRRERKWSQTQLAQLVDMGQHLISFAETGRYLPTDAQLERLGRALAMRPELLLRRVKIIDGDQPAEAAQHV